MKTMILRIGKIAKTFRMLQRQIAVKVRKKAQRNKSHPYLKSKVHQMEEAKRMERRRNVGVVGGHVVKVEALEVVKVLLQ